MQLILKRYILEELNVNASIINGETSRRQQVVDYFNQKPGFDVLILSPKAAGTGLTITSANHVIHYTRRWNNLIEIGCLDVS
jgi:SNF2 family DNA or RNA helicase